MLGAVVDAYNKSVPINTEREDKKTKLNLNNKNILLHWFITFPEGVYGGKGGKHGTFLIWTYGKKKLEIWTLGKKLEIWIFGMGGNFGFGLREKSWKLGFLGWGGYSVTSDLDLGEKVEIWIFGMGGYSVTSDLDLGKKVGNLDFWDGGRGVFCLDLDLGKKVGNLDFWDGGGGGGVFCNFGFGLREKSWKFGFLGWGGIL